jgi:hypothetical protein
MSGSITTSASFCHRSRISASAIRNTAQLARRGARSQLP